MLEKVKLALRIKNNKLDDEIVGLIEACKFATKCSAITVCRYGAQPSMPTLEEVE